MLAKSASGALEHIDQIEVRNLAAALDELHEAGFQTVGLDLEGPQDLEISFFRRQDRPGAGAEGKGLRQKTRDTVTTLARLDMPGAIRSLNVSNAAAVVPLCRARLPQGEVAAARRAGPGSTPRRDRPSASGSTAPSAPEQPKHRLRASRGSTRQGDAGKTPTAWIVRAGKRSVQWRMRPNTELIGMRLSSNSTTGSSMSWRQAS